jgi:hypothetical protein
MRSLVAVRRRYQIRLCSRNVLFGARVIRRLFVRCQGTFWLLWEDEPLGPDTSRFVDFRDGKLFDARTGAQCGSFDVLDHGVDAIFDEQHGEREVLKLRMASGSAKWGDRRAVVTPAFDPEAEAYLLTFSTMRYEDYVRSRPADDHETVADADARRDREVEEFGFVPMVGRGLRDCVELRQLGAEIEREADVRLRREKLGIVG